MPSSEETRELFLGEGEDELSNISEYQHRVRLALSRMRRANDLLDAWDRPANVKFAPPKAELERARASLRKAKEDIVEAARGIIAMREGKHTPVPCGEQGVDAEDIFCSSCGSYESSDGNDILLCDAAGCNHAYHQQCVTPPVGAEEMETDDWFCPVCVALGGILDGVNEYCERDYESIDQLFPELTAEEGCGDEEEGYDEAEDDDYVDSERDSEPSEGKDADDDDDDSDASSGSGGSDDDEAAGAKRDAEPNSADEEPLQPRRKRVDYAALAAELFGGEEDEDADPEKDADFQLTRKPRKPRKPSEPAAAAAAPRAKRAKAAPPPATAVGNGTGQLAALRATGRSDPPSPKGPHHDGPPSASPSPRQRSPSRQRRSRKS